MQKYSFRQISEYFKIVKRNQVWVASVARVPESEVWKDLWEEKDGEPESVGMSEEEQIKFQLESKAKLDQSEKEKNKINSNPIEGRVKLIRRPIAPVKLPW